MAFISKPSTATLFQQCMTTLRQLEQKDILAPELQQLYQYLEQCTDPNHWDETHFDNAVYLKLLERLRELENSQHRLHNIQHRLYALPPVKTTMFDYI